MPPPGWGEEAARNAPSHDQLSIKTQCQLLSISLSGWYDEPKGQTALNVTLLRLIDEQFLLSPYYGTRQMARWLTRQGYAVGGHPVRRLMRLLGLCAIYRPCQDNCVTDLLSCELAPDGLRDWQIG